MLDNWAELKEGIGKAASVGENIGLSDNTINNIAEKVGDFLASNVEPRDEEQKVLKELWNVANNHDKHVLAKLIVKASK